MDNELKIFRQSFRELENLFQALPITETQIEQLKDLVLAIQRSAENLALYDAITHALNLRANKWLMDIKHIRGMAKIDIYDLRQANKVYGVPVVDAELHKLAFQFTSIFTLDKGDFVYRSPGSDEFRIFSTTKTPQQIKQLLSALYSRQELDTLLSWDFGVGLNETEVESDLQKRRKAFRPLVIRQTVLESHSEIPRRIEENKSYPSWHEFNTPYERLIDKICSLKLPAKLEQQAIEQVQITRDIVENIVTRDPLTGVLNGLGAKWFLENKSYKSVALTDMLNMHEGNLRYGSAAIDQDLKRFSNMLARHFSKNEGYLLFRSDRAGDEFKITSTKDSVEELKNAIHTVWQNDLHRGLLAWNYGVGRNDSEAHIDLYKNRVKEAEAMEVFTVNDKATFVIVRPENEDYSQLYKISEEAARITEGTPIIDLHLTVQAIRNVGNFDALKKRLEEYALSRRPFSIKVKNIARMNLNNQQGRLWLLVEKNTELEAMYNDLAEIARQMGYEPYPYKFQDWLPHIKIVELPENTPTKIKDPTFGAIDQISFTVRRFEWTVQKAPQHWELLHQFSFQEEPPY